MLPAEVTYRFDILFSRGSIGNGTDIRLFSPEECGPEKQAASVAQAYSELLNQLFTPGSENQAGNRRLQYGFAAACEGCSIADWESLPVEGKETIRCKHSKFYTPSHSLASKPPSLVLYIGPKRESHRIEANVIDPEFSIWDTDWEDVKETNDLPCDWVIFLSGIYAIWTSLWKLFVCDQDDPKLTPYYLPSIHYNELFSTGRATPLPSPPDLNTPTLDIPMVERCKSKCQDSDDLNVVQISAPRPSATYSFPVRAVDELEAIPAPEGHILFMQDRNWKSCVE
ncbi:hypothetical protein C8J56DRAFT_967884 [Mycena floridula]|nr:hypothetical protein C8J56DRAFT_967884 [Mycena floridula]